MHRMEGKSAGHQVLNGGQVRITGIDCRAGQQDTRCIMKDRSEELQLNDGRQFSRLPDYRMRMEDVSARHQVQYGG